MFLLLLMVISTIDTWHVSAQNEEGSGLIQCTASVQPNYNSNCKDDEKMTSFLFNVSENHCVEFSSCPGSGNEPGFPTRKQCEDACPATECPIPLPIDKGIFYMTRAEEGTVTAHYACLNSYELVGSVERRCLYDGSWSGVQPYCKQIGVVCKTPPDVEGAVKHYSCTSPGCVVVYPCNEKAGYKRVYGKGFIKCGEDGTWINDVPTCARLRVMQDESEVSDEIQVTQGQQNFEVRCIVEPSVPQSAVVHWKRVTSSSGTVKVNTHWLSDNKSLALSFPMVNYRDAGKYKCIMELETQLERSVEFVVISPEPTINKLFKHSLITKSIIILTCAFQANTKPDVQWFLDGNRLTSGNEYVISDKTETHPQINFNVLQINVNSGADLGSYYCEANGDNTTREWFDLQQINLQQTGRKKRAEPGKAVSVSTYNNICSDEATDIVVGRIIEREDGYSLRIQSHLKLNRSSRTRFSNNVKRLMHIVPEDDKQLPLTLVKNDSYIFVVRVQSRNKLSISSYYPYSKTMELSMSRACNDLSTTKLI